MKRLLKLLLTDGSAIVKAHCIHERVVIDMTLKQEPYTTKSEKDRIFRI